MPEKKSSNKTVSSYRLPERTRQSIAKMSEDYGSEANVIIVAIAMLEHLDKKDVFLKSIKQVLKG